MKTEILSHNGKTIHYLHHQGIKGAELVASVKEANNYILKHGNILVIVDFTDSFADKAVMDELKSEESKEVAKTAKCIAVLGVDGIKKVLLNGYNHLTGSDTRAFSTLDEAKAYLASLA